ncbi:uncharacterized protein PODANS_5_3160 [Podospora anserina S mat+]|uniref:Podospora anserina S mat+ genomic DNA chromosome 5, supercontig 1 n=1 Tax=Podospora anserina (strain S / ATCC MYA-4624 / DSM 980 / FGSC 10383) TaxID=515849 RepID=B2AEB2_PODAN|nr:uncharacterized protein PODANS_5_3160 [Podospora anserina S mat+]CAP61778.1 unnamed protein product [Podospora anserina S mat+]CDP28854.1 Putative protein of unknown function [Podospora anserina S mat+]
MKTSRFLFHSSISLCLGYSIVSSGRSFVIFERRGAKPAAAALVSTAFRHKYARRDARHLLPSSNLPSQIPNIMAPTYLIVGATGNTGQSVVETLSKLSTCAVIALTRSLHSPVAKHLATLPNVQVLEKNWMDITAQWLREHEIERAFVATPSQPSQFAEETTFHVAALKAGVKYVVRISTTAANVRPDCEAYYPRIHWAIEALLSTPEFKPLQWTSLQANNFSSFWLATAAEFIKQYRKTGKQDTLRLVASEYAPVGTVDANDVGVLAAHLLLQEDISPHNNAKYVVNGPEDITGRQIVELVERYIGTSVDNVIFKDMSFLDYMIGVTQGSQSVLMSMKHGPETAWNGECTASATSEAVLKLAAPTRTPADTLKAMLQE